jgi:DNA-binding NarL/FixJ family response regulator
VVGTSHSNDRQGPQFLVVADDPQTAQALARVCQRYGTCTIRDSPADALYVLAETQPFAGVIVESELRAGSGMPVATYARQRLNLPTLLLSAHNTHRTVHEAYQIGARYLCKPVEAPELEMFVSAAAAQARNVDDTQRHAIAALASRAALTPRETQVVELALNDVPRSSMAQTMGITESTLKFHIRSLLDKCEAKNISELVRSILVRLGRTPPTQP